MLHFLWNSHCMYECTEFNQSMYKLQFDNFILSTVIVVFCIIIDCSKRVIIIIWTLFTDSRKIDKNNFL